MTPEQIREIVKITLDELNARKMLKDSYPEILRVVDNLLNSFFSNKGDGNGISYALNVLSDDPYIDIIYLQYRDGKTLEFIAEALGKDVSTVKRNKKRLIMSIYEVLQET